MKSATYPEATAVFTGRALRRLARTPEVIIQTVIFPVLLFLTMLAVFSTAVEAFGSDDVYAQRLVPGLIMAGIMFGSVGGATGLFTDLHNGFMQRITTLSAPIAAPVSGIAIAEVVRSMLAVVTLCAVGAIWGFRFQAGALHALGFVGMAALAAITFSWIGLWLATVAKSMEALMPPLGAFFLVMLFMSASMVPLEAYPGFVQPFVRWNPGYAFVMSLDHLARGGEVAKYVVLAVAWSVGIVSVCGTLAARGLARRS